MLENYREIRRTTEATTIILIDQQVSVGRPSNKYNVALVAAKAKFGLAICERDSILDRVCRIALDFRVANASGGSIALCN